MKRYLLLIITVLLVTPLLVKADDDDEVIIDFDNETIIDYDEEYIEYNDSIPVEAPEDVNIQTGNDNTISCDVDYFRKCLNNNDFYERLYDKGEGYTCESVKKSRRQFFVMWSLEILSLILFVSLVLALLKIRSLKKKTKTKK